MSKSITTEELKDMADTAEELKNQESAEPEEAPLYKATAMKLREIPLFVKPEMLKTDFMIGEDGQPIKNDRTMTFEDVVTMQTSIRSKGGMTDPLVVFLVREDGTKEDNVAAFNTEAKIMKALEAGTHFLHVGQGNRRKYAITGGEVYDKATDKKFKAQGLSEEEMIEYFEDGIRTLVHVGLDWATINKISQDHAATRPLRRDDVIRSVIRAKNSLDEGEQSWDHIALSERDHLKMFQDQSLVASTDAAIAAIEKRFQKKEIPFSVAQREKEKIARAAIANTLNIFGHLAFLQRHNAGFVLEQYLLNEQGRKAQVSIRGKKKDLSKLRLFAKEAADANKLPMDYAPFKSYWNELKKAHKEAQEAKKAGIKTTPEAALPKNEIVSLGKEMVGSPLKDVFDLCAGNRALTGKVRELKTVLLHPDEMVQVLMAHHADLVSHTRPEKFARAVVEAFQNYNAAKAEKGSEEVEKGESDSEKEETAE